MLRTASVISRLLASLLLSGLVAHPVAAAPDSALEARRAPGKISVDGHLDEAGWASAPGHDKFIESFPQDGVPATAGFRTEAKVLYDDEFLYVGVHCFDPEPDKILRQLSRRDTLPTADYVQLALDPTRSGNTGYSFILNAAGVQRDVLLYGDLNSTDTWDAVWDGEVRLTADGWTAEFAIPLRVLSFQRKSEQWGIHLRRVIPRTHQVLDSTYLPRNANSANTGGLVVSRFGPLVGLVGLEPKRALELTPYAAARLTSRPQYSDPSRPDPTLLDPTLDFGLDLKTSLTSSLNLSAAINPDFGQVEADQIIQNVNTYEPFFPEKRPFFTQGLDLFQPVGSEYGAQSQLFYSRRIGLAAPILGAVKVTGSVRDGTEVGILDAVEMGAGNPAPDEANPDRRWQWHLRQPFHFGPNDALPNEAPVTRNHFAAVIRQQLAPGARVGAMFTSSVPLEDGTAHGTNAAALDFNLRTADGKWGALGQVTASQAVGGPAEGRRLADGTVLRSGDLGPGFFFRAGKLGGDGIRFDVNGTYLSPELDLNYSGFQPLSNYQWYGLNLSYVRSHGVGPFRGLHLRYTFDHLNFSTDGRFVPRGANHWVNADLQLPSFDTLFLNLAYEDAQFDLREMHGTGTPVQRGRKIYGVLGINTDQNRPLYAFGRVLGGRTLTDGPVPGVWITQAAGGVTWHPTSYLETYLEVDGASNSTGARFLSEDDAAGTALFGDQRPAYFSATFRQQVVLTPKLTIQAYAQLFSGVITYASYFQVPMPGQDRIELNELIPLTTAANHNQHFSALNLNLVLRWEYRLGSTLYVVYTRSQQELPSPTGVPSDSILPSRLGQGPATQTALVKWSYWWDV